MNNNTTSLYAIRIYLTFSKAKSRIHIQQATKELDGTVILERYLYVRKPYDKNLRIGLSGTIQTSISKYKKIHNKKVTHIGIYISNALAISTLEEIVERVFVKQGIKIMIIPKIES